jgi:hypothetical protein
MLLLKRLQARWRAHFEIEVEQECAYLRRAFREACHAEALSRMGRRKLGSFEWFVIEEAARRLAKSPGA